MSKINKLENKRLRRESRELRKASKESTIGWREVYIPIQRTSKNGVVHESYRRILDIIS